MSKFERPQLTLIQGGLSGVPFLPTSRFFTKPSESSVLSPVNFALSDDDFILSAEILDGLRKKFDLD